MGHASQWCRAALSLHQTGYLFRGSPADEAGRDDDEILHQVTLRRGYWLAETECTQALWDAVMLANPSHFKGADGVGQQLPVENITWHECQKFIKRLNERIAGLAARLPTEAEWEYACRAGSTAALSTGPLTIRDRFISPRI